MYVCDIAYNHFPVFEKSEYIFSAGLKVAAHYERTPDLQVSLQVLFLHLLHHPRDRNPQNLFKMVNLEPQQIVVSILDFGALFSDAYVTFFSHRPI
jgi:hypothetical protein